MVSEDDFYPASTLPAPLSIVWGRFPYVDADGAHRADHNPCLVLGWNEFRPGKFSVLVVFGTSKPGVVDEWCNFGIYNASQMLLAGLNKVTLFDLGKWKWIQWHAAWFKTPDTDRWPTPVIGHVGHDGAAVLRYQLDLRAQHSLPTPPRPKPRLVASNPASGE